MLAETVRPLFDPEESGNPWFRTALCELCEGEIPPGTSLHPIGTVMRCVCPECTTDRELHWPPGERVG